jgi:hypothetical protein
MRACERDVWKRFGLALRDTLLRSSSFAGFLRVRVVDPQAALRASSQSQNFHYRYDHNNQLALSRTIGQLIARPDGSLGLRPSRDILK